MSNKKPKAAAHPATPVRTPILFMHDPCYFVKILLSTKSTYSAKITALKPLTVLMSLVPLEVIDNGDTLTFLFQQTVPSYLIALAIGILASKTLSPISKLWFEPKEIDKNVYEFEQTSELLKIVESVCGPYVKKMYDLLVMPSSFLFGGMEK
ncbi:leukotriene A-4 hydrolase, partial [Aphis craccivora]